MNERFVTNYEQPPAEHVSDPQLEHRRTIPNLADVLPVYKIAAMAGVEGSLQPMTDGVYLAWRQDLAAMDSDTHRRPPTASQV